MKVGDLVKYKWITMAQKKRAEQFGCRVDSVGMIVDIIGSTRLLIKFVDMPDPLQVMRLNLEKVA